MWNSFDTNFTEEWGLYFIMFWKIDGLNKVKMNYFSYYNYVIYEGCKKYCNANIV